MGRLDLPEPTPQQQLPFGLTHRELDVILCESEGLTVEEAGVSLSLSAGTIRGYRASALRRLQARNFAHAVAIYYRWLRENDRLVRSAA